MKRMIFLFAALLCSAVVSAQVNDYYFENRDAFRTFPQLLPANAQFDVDYRLNEIKNTEL